MEITLLAASFEACKPPFTERMRNNLNILREWTGGVSVVAESRSVDSKSSIGVCFLSVLFSLDLEELVCCLSLTLLILCYMQH